jgi:hypothetical protein
MIKKNLIFTGFLLLACNLFGQVRPDDIYDAINQLIEINNVKTISKGAKPLNINKSSMKEYFYWCLNFGPEKIRISEIDSAFIKNQLSNPKALIWDKKKLNNKAKIKRKAVDYFTIPLFLNKNMDLFVIYHTSYVGPLDAKGTLELYKKINSEWKLFSLNLEWIS